MPDLTSSAHAAIATRWRARLLVVIAVLALGALVATIIAVAYGESLLTPVLLWLGVGALVLALLQLPRSLTPGERPRMAASAAWLIAGIVLYVVVPMLVSQ
ncbi:MAG: hypothetical protein AVDCRST_MAG60-1996 [uncultured Nocardioides sp.]|uniref:Uncharacterized protein n=1 Tax=uncultured Nocardioides sp. TaxID=198441 RepID=A0A6J4P2S6_9ACTN|nr:MAG: hypothetical protein AVDCRST_MAG60-1996 [uncultured Nocardioides sp.]